MARQGESESQISFEVQTANSDTKIMFKLLPAAILLATLGTSTASAQTYTVLHAFTGGADGAAPADGLTIDRNGNLFGTASAGANQGDGCGQTGHGCGAVFKMTHAGSGWVFTPLFDFLGGTNGGVPGPGVTFGPDGALYGLAGVLYKLTPPATFCRTPLCPWNETVIYQFPAGWSPSYRVIFDTAGNMYGATFEGGTYGEGSVYQLTPANGGWNESVIYSFDFNVGLGAEFPSGPLVFDQAGNLYGTAYIGNEELGCFGGVWQLQPSQSGWNYNLIYSFNGFIGAEPSGLIRDGSGNLYGITGGGVGNNSGTVYELSPSDGGWTYSLVYDFGYEDYATGLVMDRFGNLYGVDSGYPFGDGYVFKLTRSGDTWIYSVLHNFHGADGSSPQGQLVLDSSGNLYGTTSAGGEFGDGVVWEIAQ